MNTQFIKTNNPDSEKTSVRDMLAVKVDNNMALGIGIVVLIIVLLVKK